MTVSARDRFIALTTATYAILALIWIFLSDRLLASFVDIESIVWLSTAKGVFFVVVTAAAFFLALRAVPGTGPEGNARHLFEALVSGITPGRISPWLTYAFAVAITLSMLMLRYRLGEVRGGQLLLILFMFPIIFSALLGGLGPGLVSTALAALSVNYTLIAPSGSLRISDSVDLLNWSFLIANGVAVSVLSEALRRSLSRAKMNLHLLDAVVAGTPDAIFVKDKQGCYLMANEAAARFVGRKQSEIVGRDDNFLFPEASAQEVMALDREIMAACRTQTHEERLTTFDGRSLVFQVTKGPVLDDSGRVVGLFGISREITDRKMAEDEILRLNAKLEKQVAERTAALHSANRGIEDLAYALAHNLRAPLRAIGGFSRLLVDEHGRSLDSEARTCLDQIVRANGTMGELLDGVLSLLRCTRGELRRENVDISAVANWWFDAPDKAGTQRKVIRHVESGLIASGDRRLLEAVVKQLLDNAWKFTQGKEETVISVSSGEVDGQPGVCVADNGAGFDMAHVKRLFQPFQRLHRHDEFPGIGVGLAVVRRIITHHGGEIRGMAEPDRGATFCFTLPRLNASREEFNE